MTSKYVLENTGKGYFKVPETLLICLRTCGSSGILEVFWICYGM